MIVFKTYLKVLNKNKGMILLYTIILVFFAYFNQKNNDNEFQFEAEKPNIAVVNEDQNSNFTNHFLTYLENHTNIIEYKSDEERNDALFYREIDYIIFIPNKFGINFLKNNPQQLEIKSAGNVQSTFVQMFIQRYFKVASMYRYGNQDQLLENMDKVLQREVEVVVTSNLDSNLSSLKMYYNFLNYSLLAGCVFVICFIISSFRDKNIEKRTIMGSINYKKYNFYLLIANALFGLLLWLLYVVLGILLFGKVAYTPHGLLMSLNAFLFMISALSFAFLIGNLIHNKEAISGLVNVVALGSSFLCGAFVPSEFLPASVLKIAHFFPSYYYISNNEIISKLEHVTKSDITPILVNMGITILFTLGWILLANIFSKKERTKKS